MIKNCWVQSRDFSSEDLGDLSQTEIIAAFNAIDWTAKLTRDPDADPDNWCPPGFGINRGANTLHLCPNDMNTIFFLFDQNVEVRRWGLFKSKQTKSHYVESYPFENVHKVVRYFMNEEFQNILAIK